MADAENLFEAARRASGSGSPDCDWAIVIGRQGEIRMLEAAGWTLSCLLVQQGAETAYRVTREDGRVRLEGRHGSETCLLRSESPAAAARHLFEHSVSHSGAAWIPGDPSYIAEVAPARPTVEIWKMLA